MRPSDGGRGSTVGEFLGGGAAAAAAGVSLFIFNLGNRHLSRRTKGGANG